MAEGLGRLAHAQHVQHRERGGLVLDADLREAVAHLARHLLRAVGVGDPAVGAHDVGDRHPWDRGPVRQAAALQDREPLAREAAPELAHEARLAHAGLAHDAHHLPPALADLVEQVVERAELPLPPDERAEAGAARVTQRRAAAPVADDPVGVDGGLPAPQIDGPERLGADVSGHQARGRLADEDLPRRGRGLQTGGHVDGVADRREVDGHLVAEVPQHHHAAVDPHPGRERLAVAVDGERVLLQPPPDAERGQQRPPGVVLVRHRRADERHEAVPEELVDGAAVAVDLGQGELEEAAEQLVHSLGAEVLGQGRRAHDVAEQHRDLLALPLRFVGGRRPSLGRERGSAVGAEGLGGVGRLATPRTPPAERGSAVGAETRVGAGVGAAAGAGRPHGRTLVTARAARQHASCPSARHGDGDAGAGTRTRTPEGRRSSSQARQPKRAEDQGNRAAASTSCAL